MTTESIAAPVGKQRVEALTEGIYAITLTLLVLELKLPVMEHGTSDADLLAALHAIAPKALSWILSFWVLAMFWLGHVRIFRVAKALSWSLVWLEVTQLAFVSLLPFSTSLLGEHGDLKVAAVVYSLNLLAVSMLSSLRTWLLLRTPELQEPNMTDDVKHRLAFRAIVLAVSAVATLVLAFFVPGWNMLAMIPTAFLPVLARL